MVVGRLCGWLLIALAMLGLSADMVVALGPGEHVPLAAGDVLLLLAGPMPWAEAVRLLALPAWLVAGAAGLALCWACRRRPRRLRRFRRA